MDEREKKIIYGVDITKKITPSAVKEAIIECFLQAHSDILDFAREYFGCATQETFQKMKRNHVEDLIETIIGRVGGDYENPTKETLISVLEELKSIASIYREPEIIQKHVEEIMLLINKLE